MKEVRLDLFKLHDENDRNKGEIKALLNKDIYRKILNEIKSSDAIKNKDIAESIGIEYYNFMKTLQNGKIPINSLERLIMLYCKTTNEPKDIATQKILNNVKGLVCNSGKAFCSVNYVRYLSEDLCKIAGAIITDGCLHLEKDKRGHGYLIEISDYYEDNLNLFCRWIKTVFGINVGYKHHKFGNYFEVRFKNKIIFRYLDRILQIPVGKKSRIVKMPELIKTDSLYQKSFVSSALIFDGGVVFKNGYYQFATQSPQLLEDIVKTLTQFGTGPDYIDKFPDKNDVYRFVIRKRDKLRTLLNNFIEPNTTKYKQLELHIHGFKKLNSLEERIKTLGDLYPDVGNALTFSKIMNTIPNKGEFGVSDVIKKLNRSKDVIKRSLNKLEDWEILTSNKSKGKINKVWSINPNLKNK